MSVDANDCIFSIAYGVVDVESRQPWAWFLMNLAHDLNTKSSHYWIFMADKEKVCSILIMTSNFSSSSKSLTPT